MKTFVKDIDMRLKAVLLGACAFLLVAAVSCKKDNVILYNDVSFVTAVAGRYYTDFGLEYVIVENASEREIPAEGRLIISSDILKKVKTGVYNVRINDFALPLTKDAAPAAVVPTQDDPTLIENGWFSGGYLNVLLGLYVKNDSDVKHILNLAYTLPTETNDTLYLQLRHNALGDVPTTPAQAETEDFTYARTYACFRMNELLPEGTVAPVKVTWRWFVDEDSSETEESKFIVKLKF